ncbi:flippase [Exiguobacterium sp. s16]|uniref:flippase n=1 Tax=Exiguobacterium sp. s16 TaxID=2751237 RepID=UPI001BE97F2A|nr:flippase [Exiguobacterium sp. s16]
MQTNNKKIFKNLLYTVLNQFVTLFLPFIMIPYLARTLGANSLGINSYAYALASFFSVIAIYGIQAFGSREIAYANENHEIKKEIFSNLLLVKLAFTFVSLLLYVFYILNFETKNTIYLLVYSLFIVNTFVDVTWFYIGEEKFKTVALRNMAMKLLPAVAIFFLVKDSDDLIKYIFINLTISFIANVYLLYDLRKYFDVNYIKSNILKRYLKIAFPFFFSNIIIQIFAQLDRVFLGNLSNIYEVSLYDQGQKLILIILGFLSTISIVLSPRMASYYNNNDFESLKKYLNISLQASLLISIPSMFGIILIGHDFSLIFYGSEFKGIENVVIFHSPMLIFTSLGMIFGAQLLMQIGKMQHYNIGLLVGATVSILLNFMLVPDFGAVGSTISKVITELTVAMYFTFIGRKFIDVRKILKASTIYFFSALIFFMGLNSMDFNFSLIGNIILNVVLGLIVYISFILLLRDSFAHSVFKKITKSEEINKW